MRHCSLGLRSCEASLKYVMTGDVGAKMFSLLNQACKYR